jgi:hypothetical protein
MENSFSRASNTGWVLTLISLLTYFAFELPFVQPAAAQDCDPDSDPSCYVFGWEPFPPSSWDGGWDARLSCGAVQGITNLDRTPSSGPDRLHQTGQVKCTFLDDKGTTTTSDDFRESAICTADITFNNLTESCSPQAGNSTLTLQGFCPFQKGKTTVGASGTGTIDCRGGRLDANGNPIGGDPTFCTYAGTNPTGNTSGDCRWNVGYGVLKASNVVPLTQTQCQTAFPADGVLQAGQIFNYTQTYATSMCTGPVSGLGSIAERFCHSDTWDGSQAAACKFPKGAAKNTGSGVVESFLTADTEYSPNSINPACNPTNSGIITLTVLGNNVDPNTNPIAVQDIVQNDPNQPITVNDRPVSSCTLDLAANTLTCKVNRCDANGVNIIAGTISTNGQTATLTMEGVMADGTRVVGDVETKNVSTSAP